MIEKIKKWWNGKDIFHENKPSDPVIFIGWSNKKHWTSSLLHWIVSIFTNPERRSAFLAALAFITFIFMILKYFTHTDSEQYSTYPKTENREASAPINKPVNQ